MHIGGTCRVLLGALVVAALTLAGGSPAWASGDGQSVAAGGDHNCGVRANGHVDCWGRDWVDIFHINQGSVAGPNASTGTFTQAVAAPGMTCALTVAGKVTCWGADSYARWYTIQAVNTAVQDTYTQVTLTSGGLGAVCALQPDGHPTCWGASVPSGTPPAEPLTHISVADAHWGGYWDGNYACGLTAAGRIACWGANPYNLLDAPNASTDTFTQISAGPYSSVCGVTTDARIKCWGPNPYGIDSGPTASTDTFTQVSAGFYETCGVRSDGRLRCWGPSTPQVTGPNASTDTFTEVSVGWNNICAVKTNGHMQCWGDNAYGQVSGANASPYTYGYQSDTTPPTLAVVDLTAEATGPSGAPVDFTVSATDPDDEAGPVTCTPASGSVFSIGATTVACSSTDTHGNKGTAQFTVTVRDTTPPVLSNVPADIVAEATGPAGAVVTFGTPTATDLVDGPVPVSCSPAAGATFAIQVTTVTCSATDKHGNTGGAAFLVTVQDTTPPVIGAVPGNFAVDATGPTGALVTYPLPTAVDLVDGAVPVLCTPAPNTIFSIGDNPVACTATDRHGNHASAGFVVHVRGAAEQLSNLLAYVSGIGPGRSLAAKVGNAITALSSGDTADAIAILNALVHETTAQGGKSLTPAQAAYIVTSVSRIESVLGV